MSVKYSIVKIHRGKLLEEEEQLTLMQLCRTCKTTPSLILELVQEGILDPKGQRVSTWRFSYTDIEKVRTVMHLLHDLRVNIPGAALALHLLEKVARLETLQSRR